MKKLLDKISAYNIGKAILLIFGFILTIQIGAFLTEKVKAVVAENIEYKSIYRPGMGRSFYYNQEIVTRFDSVRGLYENGPTKYKNYSREWAILKKEDQKDHAMIELSGMAFTFFVSILGLSLFFYRRRKGKPMDITAWIGILLGLFFMRDLVINSGNLYIGFILCDEATLWTYFNLPVFASIRIFTVLGFVLFFFICYSIPKGSRLLFFSCGFIGAFLGLYVWLHFLSKMLLM